METLFRIVSSNSQHFSSLLLPTILFLVTFVWLYNERKFRKIKTKLNLEGPKPWPIFGNIPEMFTNPITSYTSKLRDKYGRIYLLFFASSPRIVICDRELIRQISTKDHNIFPNHSILPNNLGKYFGSIIFFLKNSHWKRVRALMSPTFTSSRMKRMFTLIDVCGDDLIDCIGEQIDLRDDKVIKTRDVFSLYTLDGIASCGYALKLKREKGDCSIEASASRNEMAFLITKMFKFQKFRALLLMTLPSFITKYISESQSEQYMRRIGRYVGDVIENRRAKPSKYDDYLQVLMDAKLDDKLELNEMDEKENHHAGVTHTSLLSDQDKLTQEVMATPGSKVQLSAVEMMANAVFLLAVGLETTSNLLSSLSYTLAHHPEIQERLHDEIKMIAKKEGDRYKFDYDEITANAYLDSVICENLRTLTPISWFDRESVDDYYIEKYNVLMPKGSIVQLNFSSVHSDPEYWPEPHKFDPNRFMPENRDKILPGSYTPFGQGPRHCLGMRFSLTEAKLAVAKLVMCYKLSPIPGTSWPPTQALTHGLVKFKNIDVTAERRAV